MLIDILQLLMNAAEFFVLRLKNRDGAERAMTNTAPCRVSEVCVMRWVNIFRLVKDRIVLRERVYYVGVIAVNDSRSAERPGDGSDLSLAENFIRHERSCDSSDKDSAIRFEE